MFSIDSSLFEVSLATLRPTQITVGFEEVEDKRKDWARLRHDERQAKMREELFPVVRGPGDRLYVLDHHHAALAMVLEGGGTVHAGLVKDLSHLGQQAFWIHLDHFSWVHAYDAKGVRRSFDDIPGRFVDLQDDPYRSFAAAVRDAGGFAKPPEPFQEFLWANFFRGEIPAKAIRADRRAALKKAVALARSDDAKHLPGWSGKK
ncbi:MAG: ParB-like protein [Burkholderiaceae bacterium]